MSVVRQVLIVDPTHEEESLATSSLTLVTMEDGSICHIEKPGNIRVRV